MPHLRNLFPPLLPLVLLLALSGCGHLSESGPAERAEEFSACENHWLLESLSVNGRKHRSRLLWQKLLRDRPYFTCDKLGYVRGSTGSNPYLGRFALSDSGKISWLQAPVISRVSDVRDSGDLEKDYLKALSQTDSLTVEGDTLILQGPAIRMEFTRVENGIR
ncbi:META domain-containing protein [Microbulbifer thermotolerans]|uniref:META domain-containing protein n=1 Tax=Microbulbifer thermotolerans TaxID=252514 RepID=UPI002248920A|nr:META domain-containing protein [Microbulbifer thermotolerans]MCX2832951.1 META domain-containing protein [Microbulbifer thermotolerans]